MASDAVTIIDAETVGASGTTSASYEVPNLSLQHRAAHAVVIEGDANGGNVDLTVDVTFNGVSGNVAPDGDNSYTALDLTGDAVVVYPESRGAATLEVTIDNNGGSGSVISVHVVPYRA